MYEGPKLKDSEVSTVLYINPPNIIIEKVDGKEVVVNMVQVGRVQIKPGKHTFRVKYNYSFGGVATVGAGLQTTINWLAADIEAVTEANHNYIFRATKNLDGEWSVHIVDKGENFPAYCYEHRFWANDHSKFYSMGCDAPDKQINDGATFPIVM
jgi:hypothetical protein